MTGAVSPGAADLERELVSGDRGRRRAAAMLAEVLANLGLDVPAVPLVAALAVESDEDAAAAIRGALQAIDALAEQRRPVLAPVDL